MKSKSTRKRAQVQSQIFIYMLAIIITALILIYGYNSFKKIKEQGEVTELINFQTNIKRSVDTLSYDYGSVKTKEFNVPGNFRKVCFVSLNPLPPLSALNKYPLIKDSVASNVQKNVFLWPPGTESFYGGNISIDPADNGYFCANVSYGRISLRLEGLGNAVKISKVT
jgi:hypothetical protein